MFRLEAELRKLKVKKFVPGEHNYYIGLGHGSELVHFYNSLHIEFPELTYFDGDNLPEVVENINEHGITKEEFLRLMIMYLKKRGIIMIIKNKNLTEAQKKINAQKLIDFLKLKK